MFLHGPPWYRLRLGRLGLDLAACLILSAIVASALATPAAPGGGPPAAAGDPAGAAPAPAGPGTAPAR